MTFHGDQGPFDDAIIGHSDYSGWIYDPYAINEKQTVYCQHCQERCDWLLGDQRWVCWACDNPVPLEWEQQHWDVLIMDVGLLYLTHSVAR